MKRILTVVFICALLLTGCAKTPGVKLVSQISVDWEWGAADRIYTDPQKIQRVLNQMRQLGQRFAADRDPVQLSDPTVTLTVSFTDGSCHRHQLRGDRYIQTDSLLWQQADPAQIQRLQFLLKALPGDEG